jgi:hypothetical protein|tara:strand:+ start:270 stop:893 length:624 start_codon:yes stop_codon:yes gene_type:complete
MPLWEAGADTASNKPKFAPVDEDSDYNRGDIYATNSGWVQAAGTGASGNDNASAQAEVLVAIGGLAGSSATTGLQEATISAVRFITGAAPHDLSAGSQTLQIEIEWDEAVTVVGSPTMKVVSDNAGSGSGRGPYTCVYTATGSTANQKRFVLASQTLVANDVLSIGTALHDAVTLAGGSTIKDTASGTINSQRNLLAAVRVTATVTA